MVRNFTRSISGWVGSCASSRTRRIKFEPAQLAIDEIARIGETLRIARGIKRNNGFLGGNLCFAVRHALTCRSQVLMANVFRGNRVNRILGHVRRVIADAFEARETKIRLR
jgi:hypothetical protein